MEGVLDTYQQPEDACNPVVCVNETSNQYTLSVTTTCCYYGDHREVLQLTFLVINQISFIDNSSDICQQTF